MEFKDYHGMFVEELHDYIDSLESQLKVNGDGWISVEDRLPKPSVPVIVRGGCAYYSAGDKTWYTLMERDEDGFNRPIQWKVTKWMEFPKESDHG